MSRYKTHDFDECIDFSLEDLPEINSLYTQFFGAGTIINRSLGLERDMKGVDVELIVPSGERKTVQEKKRRKYYPDILIEYVSQLVNNKVVKTGWIYHLEADYLAYIQKQGNGYVARFYPVLYLKLAWEKHGNEWKEVYGIKPADNQSYVTLNTPVPFDIIECAISDEISRSSPVGKKPITDKQTWLW